jgi:oligopeptide transport system substrate-binding protein
MMRSRHRQPSRRLVLAAGTAAAALSGCGGAVVGLDPANKSLDIGNGSEPLSLDPHKASGEWENNIIGNMFVGLTTEDAQAQPIPGMAERWGTSEDGLTWTFHLREASWSDGEPCTAFDFEYAFRRILDSRTIAEYASILYGVLNAEACKKGDLPIEALGVRAIDARTFEIKLEHPAPYLPGLMKHYTAFPVPRHVVEKHGDAWIAPQNVVTNGPFTLVKWWSNYMIELKRNPRFYDADNVQLEHLYFYPTLDDDAAARRVMRGELAWSTSFPGKKQDYYARELPGYVQVHPWLQLNYLSLNTRRPPFNDVRVRKAMALAVDREFLAREIWKAGYTPAYSIVPAGMYNWPQGARASFADIPLAARREEAVRLLAEAGYGPEKPLKFTLRHRNSRENPRIAVVLQNDWSTLAPWLEVDLLGTETQIHYAALRAADFEAADGGWIADFNDPRNYLYLFETRTGPQNYPGFSNPTYDKLMFDSDNERDVVKRAAMMRAAEQIALDECPLVALAFASSTALVHPRIQGWEGNLENIHRARWMKIKAS